MIAGPEARATLYVGGKRRPGPNLWGFDPGALVLVPPMTRDGHRINHAGFEFWANPATFDRLLELVHTLARRKRVGTRSAPVRRHRGEYRETDLEVRERDLTAPAAESVCRLMAWILRHCDWRTGRIGLFIGGKVVHPSRCDLADWAGFPVRIDDKKRIRAYRLDRVLQVLIAAGLLWRHVEDDRGTVEFKVTRLGFILSGVQQMRVDAGAYERKKAIAAEQEERARRRSELAAGPARALVAELAEDARPDEFTAGRRDDEAARMIDEFRRRHERRKPPS